MDHDGDTGDGSEDSNLDRDRYDHAGYLRTNFMRHALNVVIAVIAIGAAVASIPNWGSADFPVTSLIIYVAGMVFIAMPLCLYYESLLKSHRERVAHARQLQGSALHHAAF